MSLASAFSGDTYTTCGPDPAGVAPSSALPGAHPPAARARSTDRARSAAPGRGRIATLDMFTFGVGYMSLKEGIDRRYYLPEFIRDLLVWALSQESCSLLVQPSTGIC